jgi:F-type H+-transporting ATPase subunit b
MPQSRWWLAVLAGLVLAGWIGHQAGAQAPKAEVEAGDFARADQAHDPAGAELGAEAHAGAAHDAHAGEHAAHGNTDPLSIDPDLAVFTLVVFLILLGVMSKFAWRPIVEGFERREKNIAENLAAAQAANEEARRRLADYERRLASAQDEVRAILDEARRDAAHTTQEMLAKARAEAQAERDRALSEILAAKEQALGELAGPSASMAVDLASRIVQQRLNATDHAGLIEEATAGFRSGRPTGV